MISPELRRRVRAAVVEHLVQQQQEDGMDTEMRRTLQGSLKALQEKLARGPEIPLTLFEVNPIDNGFLVSYNTTEEFSYDRPKFDPNAAIGSGTKMETVHRWRLIRAKVYCADAAAIKVQVDEAVALDQKVKLLIAEGKLVGEDEAIAAVGA